MIIHPTDRHIVKWAVDRGFPHEYRREYNLPDRCLAVHLGLSTAYFHEGKLAHFRADTQACYMDQLMYELTLLFGFCAQNRAYPDQQVFLTAAELSALQRPA
jgi:hypothetical protein